MKIKTNLGGDTKISKYLDLTKFIDFIQNDRLYFRQVSQYDDLLEGHYPSLMYLISQGITHYDNNGQASNTGLIESTDRIRKLNYVNCWTLSEHENMGLWSVYSGKSGVAIESTVSQVMNSLNRRINSQCTTKKDLLLKQVATIKLDKILYIDHRTTNLDKDFFQSKNQKIDPVFLKNFAFKYEQEVRIAIDFTQTLLKDHSITEELNDGFYLDEIPAPEIINGILIPPNADEWFFDLIKNMIIKHGLRSNLIKWSGLNIKHHPLYKNSDFFTAESNPKTDPCN